MSATKVGFHWNDGRDPSTRILKNWIEWSQMVGGLIFIDDLKLSFHRLDYRPLSLHPSTRGVPWVAEANRIRLYILHSVPNTLTVLLLGRQVRTKFAVQCSPLVMTELPPRWVSHKFFGLVGDHVVILFYEAIDDFLNHGKLLKQLNTTMINLIPKVGSFRFGIGRKIGKLFESELFEATARRGLRCLALAGARADSETAARGLAARRPLEGARRWPPWLAARWPLMRRSAELYEIKTSPRVSLSFISARAVGFLERESAILEREEGDRARSRFAPTRYKGESTRRGKCSHTHFSFSFDVLCIFVGYFVSIPTEMLEYRYPCLEVEKM
ncbi:hypothetical protein Nepgr_006659 [Nepenthes gracilis]|uniref:Uncharacterized protein n=1 Tax=Nepenthes gracilis TaxID=150966 RepID=A0AAD3S5G8_NEPGR|nr:hypothetical protein Nepgr_006659 [Nepenthes gracilis]